MTDEDTDNNLERIRIITCHHHHGVTDLEDGEGDALAGLQPPILAALAQARDLGRDLGQRRALVGGEELLEAGPGNDNEGSLEDIQGLILPFLPGQALRGGGEDM